MRSPRFALSLAAILVVPTTVTAASPVTINSDLVLVIDGKKIFPIGFTMPPPPDGTTPEGRNAIDELAAAGATFLRTGAQAGEWNEAIIARERAHLDAAARHGMYTLPFLRELAYVDTDERAEKLRALVNQFKDHPGLGAWKGDDEPEWGKRPVESLVRAREIIRQEDPHHPVVIIHAPRGTVESLRPYNATGEILGVDIYPIGYPPGGHSLLPNKNISLVGDHARIIAEVAEGRQPFWMVLQIAWSGVTKPGKTLRFPTFAKATAGRPRRPFTADRAEALPPK